MGGRGDDTLYLPETFRDAKYYGGLGNDSFVAIPELEAEDNTATNRSILLSGDAGDDKIEGPHLAGNTVLRGGDDDDKIIGGNDNDTQKIYGEDHDDIIYGGDAAVTSQEIFGDFMLAGLGTPILGGNDKIYGGDDIIGTQTIAGGTYDDTIWSGSNVTGDITIFGDNDTSTPLVEDEIGLNINDGDDIIEVGNGNMNVKAYG